MASSSTFPLSVAIILLVTLTQAFSGDIIFEEGYTVTTVIDGNKLQINPSSVLALHGSSSDLIILDHLKSTLYTVSFSNPQESVVRKLSGNGGAGYLDGDLGSAMFNKPKSFAFDMKNNIYIADKTNHAIRKISKSGVTTIAGGYTQKIGNTDGAGKNASFSADFEVAFIPQRCALLISDHGNRLVRQIDLKAEDCAATSSGSVLGSTTAWALGIGVACLIGLIVGFSIRPYVLPHETQGRHLLNATWKHCLINLGKQVPTFFFDIRNVIVSLKLSELSKQFIRLSFSQLSLIFGLNIIRSSQSTPVKYTSLSLLDSDVLGSNELTKSQVLLDQFKDLLTFDGTMKPVIDQENVTKVEGKNDGFLESDLKIDSLINANIAGFVEGGKRTSLESSEIS